MRRIFTYPYLATNDYDLPLVESNADMFFVPGYSSSPTRIELIKTGIILSPGTEDRSPRKNFWKQIEIEGVNQTEREIILHDLKEYATEARGWKITRYCPLQNGLILMAVNRDIYNIEKDKEKTPFSFQRGYVRILIPASVCTATLTKKSEFGKIVRYITYDHPPLDSGIQTNLYPVIEETRNYAKRTTWLYLQNKGNGKNLYHKIIEIDL